MSLPPGFLDELRSRLSLTQVVGRKVIWDPRKSNQAKGDMWAPCPFHQEKTASFHVDDRKGFYYCFGCQAKGDAITFVRETENVDFMEAVRILSQEAGLQIPERDPEARKKADRRATLSDVMDSAVQHFRLGLRTAAGRDARDYLERRGLSSDAQDRFEIGFAADTWQGLWDYLTGKGVGEDQILACGLAKPSQKGGRPYDTFRNRIMFPIRDPRGRCIAFGGRAMDPGDSAKYLNSPETELFDKSRTLFNHGPAREAAGKGAPLIVAEGYMDVIALSEAGFTASVAPLGTAVTEHQLALLWRICEEPVIALDGDAAGLRAANRVIDLALPMLEAGKSLRFAILPDGQDPDDLIRSKGAPAIQTLLNNAAPMVDMLWKRETEGRVFDSPERKAALDKVLRDKIKLIRDPSLRSHYGQAIKDRRWKLFRDSSSGSFGSNKRGAKSRQPQGPVAATLRARSGELPEQQLREAVIFAVLIRHPLLLTEFDTALERLPCNAPGHADLRDALLECDPACDDGLVGQLSTKLGGAVVEKLLSMPHLSTIPAIRKPDDTDVARLTLQDTVARLETVRASASEIEDAIDDLSGSADEVVTWRLSQAAKAKNTAFVGSMNDTTEYDEAPNGAQVNREERDRLDALLDQIGLAKRTEK
ncbi:MAG: DNA primase [Pseudomonadota bacterium]